MAKRLAVAALFGVVLMAGAVYLSLPQAERRAAEPAAAPPVTLNAVASDAERVVPQSSAEVKLSFAPVVKRVSPSVVNVYATTVEQVSASPFANDPFFQRFLGGGLFDTRPRESQSLGSGVIVDPSGVILTNSHVVSGATDIRIALSDGREFAVKLVLDDPKTDLAVLRITDPAGTEFPAISFADSDTLAVGDLVLAIGNPFGVGQTTTSGIVSALARTGVEASDYEFFIQTDAAINPGNSGGALVDLDGRLVGVNTAIFSRSGGSIGIGFAIPSNMARVIAEAGIAGGEVKRPWFGARLQALNGDLARSVGLDRARGALVAEVAPGSSAEKSGFKAGDVILSADGFSIDQPTALDFRLATKALGATVPLTFWRDNREQTATLTLAGPPDAGPAIAVNGNTRFAGATVETVTPAIAQELGLPFNAAGVVVRVVEPGSPADRMGLRVGDVIAGLNGKDTTTAESFRNASNGRPDSWQITLQRGGRTIRAQVAG